MEFNAPVYKAVKTVEPHLKYKVKVYVSQEPEYKLKDDVIGVSHIRKNFTKNGGAISSTISIY
jgi:hypothetical protein